MPRLNINDQALIQKARAMASAASTWEAVFSQGLLSANYAADLETAADRLTAALQERVEAVGEPAEGDRAGLHVDMRTARKRLRVIDRLVMAVIIKYPALVAEWNSAKQVAKKAALLARRRQRGGRRPGWPNHPGAGAQRGCSGERRRSGSCQGGRIGSSTR